jgi:NAD(P)-dependent dehydrogenase (short-subunit alcohol dehydrogenase family)
MTEKLLLITGGSRGIGAATARAAAREGYNVIVNYVTDDKAAKAVAADVEKAGRQAGVLQADISKESDIIRLFDTIREKFGRITHLVNNAGIVGRAGPLIDADTSMIRAVIDLNVTGAILVAREAAKQMSTVRGGNGGAIVNTSSIAASLGGPGEFTWYAASKGAIDSLTVGLSRELAKDGIRVNAVSPGLIDTEIHAAGGQPDRLQRMGHLAPLGRAGTADGVASAILWLLSDAASYVTGANIRVGGGR